MLHKDRLLDSAQKFLAKGQLAKAIGEYQKLVDAFPRDYRHLQKLAELLCREQRYSEALPYLERVAENFTTTGFYLKAIAIYKQIQKIDPARIATSQQIAELYERQGLIGTALSEYRQQFLVCERNGQIEEAQDLLLKMIHLDPDNTALRCRLIETLLALGEEAKAATAFQALVSLLAVKDEQAAIARLYEQFPGLCPDDAAGQQPPGTGSTDLAVNIAPDLPEPTPVDSSGPSSAAPESAPAAEPFCELELELNLDGLEGLGEVPTSFQNEAAGSVDSEVPVPAAADIPVDSDEDDDIEVLSEFMIFEDGDEAANQADETSKSATAGPGFEESQSHFDLGIAYKEMGRYQLAIEEFDKAALDPGRVLDCLNLKGQCLIDQGEVDAAETTFRAALAHPAVNGNMRMVLHYELGLLYEYSARPLEALEHFQFVAEEDQFFRDVATKLQALRRRLGLDDPPPSSSGGQAGSDRISYV